MGNVLDPESRRSLRSRLRSLEAGRAARWGRMNVEQMVCHVADPMRIALGELAAADVSSIFTRHVLRRLVLAGLPPPKGRIRTFEELDQVKGGGTRSTGLAADLDAFDETLDRFVDHVGAGRLLHPNPVFGPLAPREWGRLVWVHAIHHLRQFGA